MLNASRKPVNDGLRKLTAMFLAAEKLARWKVWLRQTTGLQRILVYNTGQSHRNRAMLQTFLVKVYQSAYWTQKEPHHVIPVSSPRQGTVI